MDNDEFDKRRKMVSRLSRILLKIDLTVKTFIESVNVEILTIELQQPEGIISMQDEGTPEGIDSSTQNTGTGTPEKVTTATNSEQSVIDNMQNNVSNVQIGASNNLETTNVNTGATKNEQSCGFQMEKPKLPKFSGDVREYLIVQADWGIASPVGALASHTTNQYLLKGRPSLVFSSNACNLHSISSLFVSITLLR